MERIPEPELMDDEIQACAYATADFESPHNYFIELFQDTFPDLNPQGTVLDLGCGPADITIRFASVFPQCSLIGVDGAQAMLEYGKRAIINAGLDDQINLLHGYLPDIELPKKNYAAVISNSLLHHLADPMVLWQVISKYAQPGVPVFIMDLMRPDSKQTARVLVEEYSADEPDILKHDFYHSLLAAYSPEEVRYQLNKADLHLRVQIVSDRHLVVSGVML